MNKTCKVCSIKFVIEDVDLEFLRCHDLPAPQLCPDCRQMRRISQINQLNLFSSLCAKTGKSIVTNHPPYVPYPVYSQQYWYSDAVDNTIYGRDIDFSKPFFEQFAELRKEVPQPALFSDFTRDENSSYTNYAGKNQDCYLIFDSDENRGCLYSYSLNSCKNVLDAYRVDSSELCYEIIDSQNCYACHFTINSSNCSHSAYIENCIGVRDCLFCINLKQKENYLFNQKSSSTEIMKVREQLKDTHQRALYLQQFNELRDQLPRRATQGLRNEDSIGNYLYQCKNAYQCFDSRQIYDGRYIYQAFMPIKSSMDCNEVGASELLYECSNLGYNGYNCKFSMNCLNQITNITYCDMCFLGCNELFGCIGLKRKSFCILNKQYLEEEYISLKNKLISHMKKTGEWGEFFPQAISSFAYNDSHAQFFYPLTEEEVSHMKLSWSKNKVINAISIGSQNCATCSKAFRYTELENTFYNNEGLEPPNTCFLCRHSARLKKRAPRFLITETCSNCSKIIHTTYSRDNRKVLCECCFGDNPRKSSCNF